MRRYAFIPSSPDPLEERITPSHSGLAGALPAAPALTQSLTLSLSGIAVGHQTTKGTDHLLQATDQMISPLGKVSLNGSLVIPKKGGTERLVHGILKISNAEGKIVVSLKGKVTLYGGPVPYASGTLTYKIISGTKAYHGAQGTGPVLYGPGPAVSVPGRLLLVFGNVTPPP